MSQERLPCLGACLLALALGVIGIPSPVAAQVFLRSTERRPAIAELIRNVAVDVSSSKESILYRQTFRNGGHRDLSCTLWASRPAFGLSSAPLAFLVNGKSPRSLVSSGRARAATASLSLGPAERPAEAVLQDLPLAPRRRVRIEMRQSTALQPTRAYRFVTVPLLGRQVSSMGNPLQRLLVRIDLHPPPAAFYCPTHVVQVERSSRRLRITLDERDCYPHGDLALMALDTKVGEGLLLPVAVSHPAGRAFPYLAIANTTAPNETRRFEEVSKAIVFLVDVTGSMRGQRLSQTCDQIRAVLARMDRKDRFNIIAFSAGTQSLFHDLQPAAPKQLGLAHAFLSGLSARGGCNLSKALLQAFEDLEPPPPCDLALVALATDSRPTVGELDPGRVLRSVRTFAPRKVRLALGAIASSADLTLLEAIAGATGGRAALLEQPEGLAAFWTRTLIDQPRRLRLKAGNRPLQAHIEWVSERGPWGRRLVCAIEGKAPLPAALDLVIEGDLPPRQTRTIRLTRSDQETGPDGDFLGQALAAVFENIHAAGAIRAVRAGASPRGLRKTLSGSTLRRIKACLGLPPRAPAAALAHRLRAPTGIDAERAFRWSRALAETGVAAPVSPDTDLARLASGRILLWQRNAFIDIESVSGAASRRGRKAPPAHEPHLMRPGSAALREIARGAPWVGEILSLERSARFSIREKEIIHLVR